MRAGKKLYINNVGWRIEFRIGIFIATERFNRISTNVNNNTLSVFLKHTKHYKLYGSSDKHKSVVIDLK